MTGGCYRAAMAISLSEATLRLLDGRNYAVLATVNADGSPHTSAMWVGRDGSDVLFSTVAGRVKHRNMLRDPHVGLALLRPGTDEVLRISGRATLIDDPDTCERLSAGGKPAVLAIRVAIDRAAFHCPRSARRAGLWQPDRWDEPMRVSFGQIYAEGLGAPEVRELFDRLSQESDAKLY